ncbi:MAG: nitrogenase cofactor biosynthesis protein NifB [Treponema sp.]|jgi:nitrogenase cofactor biosynthesis protein NifB|nr:nitrogenase cofactor biosynthesis protein NifB [Treponema sp.]
MNIPEANRIKSLTHPCFNGCGGKNTRLHLPVAPVCNIQCNYCIRKFECVNESRPGVTGRVLSPKEALDRFLEVRERLGNINVAGIAGPGDALANFEEVKETFSLIRERAPGVTFCLSTNGLLLPRYAGEIAALGVSHVTVTVNAADSKTGRRIYRFVTYRDRRYTGEEGAALLLENQYEGIRRLHELGIVVKANVVVIKGLNDAQIPAIAGKLKEAGTDLCNIMQLIPVKGSLFEHIPLTSNAEITEIRKSCEAILPQMYHCRQCRADAAGTLDNDLSRFFGKAERSPEIPGCPSDSAAAGLAAAGPAEPEKSTGLFAVASKDGMLVDQHFGHTENFYMYQYKNGQVVFLERREVSRYCSGPDDCGKKHEELIDSIIKTIEGCSAVITMRIGEMPKRRLEEKGISVFMTYDYVTDAVREAAKGFRDAPL